MLFLFGFLLVAIFTAVNQRSKDAPMSFSSEIGIHNLKKKNPQPLAGLCCCAGPQSDPGAASQEAKHEETPKNAVVLRLVSEVSTVELLALSSPQISPSSQLSDAGSDGSAAEVSEAADVPPAPAAAAESGGANGEPRTDEDKDPKQKAHLHCPVCKVTVNSVSQLEAHNSGTGLRSVSRTAQIQNPNPASRRSLPPGTKHKLILEGHSVLPRRRGKVAAARVGKSKRLSGKGSVGGAPSKSLQCEVCEIFVNSETQLSQVSRAASVCVCIGVGGGGVVGGGRFHSTLERYEATTTADIQIKAVSFTVWKASPDHRIQRLVKANQPREGGGWGGRGGDGQRGS